jgi:Ohr subfamily peroxiredoxin
MTPLYRTRVTAHGGRSGRVESQEDGRLVASLSVPRELGGAGGPGTNPEQLFAAGYAACFESTLRLVARRQNLALAPETSITAEVSLVRADGGTHRLVVAITGDLPGVPIEAARALMEGAHRVCPYSNATRGNVPVALALAGVGAIAAA